MIFAEDANAEPSLLTYNDVPEITEIIMKTAEKKPHLHEETEDGREHFMWKMTSEDSI